MIVPSGRVWEDMSREPAGLWPVLLDEGRRPEFLVKLPTHVIKAAYRSCSLSLLVCVSRTEVGAVLSTVIQVADDPVSPLTLASVHRHEEEQQGLRMALGACSTMVCFYDELARPVLRGTCHLDRNGCGAVVGELDATGECYAGPWSDTLSKVLDEVEGIIDPALAVEPIYSPSLTLLAMTLEDLEPIRIAAIGSVEVRETVVLEDDEGYGLEQAAWHLLEGLFGRGILHSPQLEKEGTARELTDVLCYHGLSGFLIETKAIAVLTTDPARDTNRRAKNIEKQVRKGLKQIGGALRAIRAGAPITTRVGDAVAFPTPKITEWHGIVMVSELLPCVDWEAVAEKVLAAAETGAHVHVLDLQELRVLVGVSGDDPIRFRDHLRRRFEILREHRSALIRTRIDGPPPP